MYSLLPHLSVVEASAFVAAPLAGMTLAQLGAEVIRVDPIGGGLDYKRWPVSNETGNSIYWAGMNKGKRSLAVNMRDPRGRELIQELATRPGPGSGILVTTFGGIPWLAQAELEKHRSDAISVVIQGNPDGSPAVDYTINCAVGYPNLTGPEGDTRPVNHVLAAWDIATGLHAALAVMTAADHRARTGQGQRVEAALSNIAMAMVGNLGQIGEVALNGEERDPLGNDLYGAFGRDFPTKDGRRIMVVAISLKQWQGLCRACGMEDVVAELEKSLGADFADEGQRFEWRHVLNAMVERWCKERTLAEIGQAFDAEALCWGPYQSVTQMLAEDPRASTANTMFRKVEHPGIGELLTPGSPLNFAGTERQDPTPAPLLGQDTDWALADRLGLSSSEIGKLHDAGIVAGPE